MRPAAEIIQERAADQRREQRSCIINHGCGPIPSLPALQRNREEAESLVADLRNLVVTMLTQARPLSGGVALFADFPEKFGQAVPEHLLKIISQLKSSGGEGAHLALVHSWNTMVMQNGQLDPKSIVRLALECTKIIMLVEGAPAVNHLRLEMSHLLPSADFQLPALSLESEEQLSSSAKALLSKLRQELLAPAVELVQLMADAHKRNWRPALGKQAALSALVSDCLEAVHAFSDGCRQAVRAGAATLERLSMPQTKLVRHGKSDTPRRSALGDFSEFKSISARLPERWQAVLDSLDRLDAYLNQPSVDQQIEDSFRQGLRNVAQAAAANLMENFSGPRVLALSNAQMAALKFASAIESWQLHAAARSAPAGRRDDADEARLESSPQTKDLILGQLAQDAESHLKEFQQCFKSGQSSKKAQHAALKELERLGLLSAEARQALLSSSVSLVRPAVVSRHTLALAKLLKEIDAPTALRRQALKPELMPAALAAVEALFTAVGDQIGPAVLASNPSLLALALEDAPRFQAYLRALTLAAPLVLRAVERGEHMAVSRIASFESILAFAKREAEEEISAAGLKRLEARLSRLGFDGALTLVVLRYGCFQKGGYTGLSEDFFRQKIEKAIARHLIEAGVRGGNAQEWTKQGMDIAAKLKVRDVFSSHREGYRLNPASGDADFDEIVGWLMKNPPGRA